MLVLGFFSKQQYMRARRMLALSEIRLRRVSVSKAGFYRGGLAVNTSDFTCARQSLVRAGLLFEIVSGRGAAAMRKTLKRIYLDHNATTALLPEVWEYMHMLGRKFIGNPSSLHYLGRAAKGLLSESCGNVAAAVGACADEIVFTSGGSEANNLVLKGVGAKRILTSGIEHASVKKTCESMSAEILTVNVDSAGFIDFDDFSRKLISFKPELVSLIFANNEIGSVQDIKKLSRIAHEHGALFHTDAVQALGKIAFNVEELGVDMMSFSAHKIGGPKGVGALYVRSGIKLEPLICGGGQERGVRAGTENLIGIAGFGLAAQKAVSGIDFRIEHMLGLKRKLFSKLKDLPGFMLNGSLEKSLPNTLNIAFDGFYAESMVNELDFSGICVSPGAACSAGKVKASHVILALGRSEEQAQCAFRISLGPDTSEDEIDCTAQAVSRIITSRSSLGTAARGA